HLEQLDEHLDLGAQHLGHDRREDVIDGAQLVALGGVHLVGEGGDEDDGRVGGLLAAADERGRLQAVHARHVDVEQDDGEVLFQHAAQRLLAGARKDEVLPQLAQDGLHDEQLLRQIIDDQDVDLVFHQKISLAKTQRTQRKRKKTTISFCSLLCLPLRSLRL